MSARKKGRMQDLEEAADRHKYCHCEDRALCAFFYLHCNKSVQDDPPHLAYYDSHKDEIEAAYRLGGIKALAPYVCEAEAGAE